MAAITFATRRRRQAGVTLIELLLVIAIVGILAAVAYPSYQEFVRRSARAQAAGILLENAQILERNYTQANRYDLDTASNAPPIITTSPRPNDGPARYTIAAAYGTAPAQTFTLTATPTGTMAGDACGALTLTQAGVKGAGGTVADCWRQ
ncbi:MAG TPA: type IV pilin protein [Thiobacillaceae bacterium]|nr:type IV pilin protein [Thiobacillaceae bacterium]HNU65229.1 type IV pilin protein [Thiobacillaceae bacterium]